MALPDPSDDACFDPSIFQSETFSVDEFVSDCKKRVSTEHLHDDLKNYYTTLKAAMVELINKDYADFLDLSANLVGMDKQIEALALPMSQLHQEILVIKHSMHKVTIGLEDKLSAREEIRSKKVMLKKALESVESVDLLEWLLDRQLDGDQQWGGLDRIAMEFNKLRHNTSATADIPLSANLTPRIEVITNRLQSILEGRLKQSLRSKDHDLLLQTLQTYSLVCNVEAAEMMFRETVVRPGLKEIVSPKAVLTGPNGLDGVYSDILKYIPKHCGFILEVSSGVPAFDILVNAIWAEIVSTIEARASLIFAPGNPDTFYKNYTSTMSFLDQFEKNCRTVEHVKHLRSHPAYATFLNKWSLPVYFQIRFQEIGGKLEDCLELPLKEEAPPKVFSLEVFSVLLSCMRHSWTEGVLLQSLTHRFWKLTLQMIVRVKLWLTEVLDNHVHRQTMSVMLCTQLVHDVQLLQEESFKLFDGFIKGHLESLIGKDKTVVQRGVLDRTCGEVAADLVPVIRDFVTGTLVQQSVKNLDPVHTIPRLYRRTNREVPTKPSGYVNNILKPLAQIDSELLGTQESRKWKEVVVEKVTEKYQELTSEVLSSVKRTEDSLLKLKRNRRSVQPVADEQAQGMSDDNKIRLQLAVDIEAYMKEVTAILPDSVSLPHFQSLLDMASLAKTTAITN